MRIIGGEFRGRRIDSPATEAVRPTKDRIREAVFNMIAPLVPGSRVLDIFAGSGAYGLEAISRGAVKAVFIDDNKRSTETIKKNLSRLGCAEKTGVIKEDSSRALERLKERKEKFDIIFADPPYNRGLAKKTLLNIIDYDILVTSGALVMEHSVLEPLPETQKDITLFKQKTYKDIVISIFLKK